jgi:hypothetical protein
VLFERHPRSNVGIVVEACDKQFIAGLEFAAEGAAQREGQRGHVGPEGDFVEVAAQQVGHSRMSIGDDLIRTPAGRERAVGVGVRRS